MRFLVVDDHPAVAAGINSVLLAHRIAEFHHAANVESGWSIFQTLNPHVVVLDTEIAGCSGLDLMARMLAHAPSSAVLIYSERRANAIARMALERGAMGYLGKHEPLENLRDALTEVASRRRYVSPPTLASLAAELTKRNGAAAQVTDRECEVIRHIANGKSVAETATLINISYRSVANACNSLRVKLNARTQMELVRLAMLCGLC